MGKKRHWAVMAGGFPLLVLGLWVFGCGQREESPNSPGGSGPSNSLVSVIHPKRKSVRRIVEQPGRVEAHEQTDLFARVPGYVRKVHVDIEHKVHGPKYDALGKEIEAGQVLAEIAVPELKEEANQKKALVRQMEAEVEQAEKTALAAAATIAIVEAGEVEAKALQERWESESKRVTKLVEGGALDAQAKDEIQNQLKAAGARVLSSSAAIRKAKADRDKFLADVRSAKARVDVAKAEAGRLEAILAYSSIRAPYDGIVTFRKVNTGDSVQPAGGKGDLLFTIARMDPVRIVVAVPEADAELVLEKAKVKLSIPALREPGRTGVVTRTSWALHPGVRTLRAELDLPNKEGLLRPGMYVHAQITGDGPETWALPNTALAKHGAGIVCYQIEAGKAVRLDVQVGRSDGEFTEVPKWRNPSSGSWEEWTGKEMVAARALGLSDGQAVSVEGSKK